MSNRGKFAADKEAILMALDQLSQTMEVMAKVVSRLKRSVEQAHLSEQTQLSEKNIQQSTDQLEARNLRQCEEDKKRPQIDEHNAYGQQKLNISTKEKQYSKDEVVARPLVLH